MMSKNSFLAKWKIDGKNTLFNIAVGFVWFFFAFPLNLITDIHRWTQQFDYGEFGTKTLESVLRERVHMDFAGSTGMIIVVAMLGCFLAFRGFGYLYSRQKMDFYESQPVSRKSRFWSRYVNGVACFVLAYLLNFLISIFVALGNGAMSGTVLGVGLHGFLVCLLSFLGAYHLSILTIAITGNLLSGILGVLVLEFYEIAVNLCAVFFRDEYVDTLSTYYGNEAVTFFTSAQCPLITSLQDSDVWNLLPETADGFVGRVFAQTWTGMLHAAVLCVVFLALAYVAYKKRPSEAAGKTIAFSFLKPWLKILLVILGGITVCSLFQAILAEEISFGVIGLVIGILLTGGITQMIFDQDIRAFFRKPLQMAAGGILAALFFVSFVFDWAGYDSYTPDIEDVESCAIALWAGGVDGGEYLDSKDQWEDATLHIIRNMKLFNVEEVNQFMEKHINPDVIGTRENAGSTWMNAELCWRLKNGKTKYRSVCVYQEDVEEALSVIMSQEEYKRAVFQIYDDEMLARAGKIEFSYGNGLSYKELPEAELKGFQEAYEKDLEKYGYELAKEMPLGYVTLELSERQKSTNTFSGYHQFNCYVYDSFENTKNYLKSVGVDSFTADMENSLVVQAEVSRYERGQDGVVTDNPDTECVEEEAVAEFSSADCVEREVETENVQTVVITDADKLAQLLAVSRTYDVARPALSIGNDWDNSWEDAYEIEFSCMPSNKEIGSSGFRSDTESNGGLFLEGKVPQWLVEEFTGQTLSEQ